MTWRYQEILTWPVWRWTISRILETNRQLLATETRKWYDKKARQKERVVWIFQAQNGRFRGDRESNDKANHSHRDLEGGRMDMVVQEDE
jgi:hypothetical protein